MKDQEWFEETIKAYKSSFKNCHLGKYELEDVAKTIVGDYQMDKNIDLDETTRDNLVKKVWYMYLHTDS